MKISDDRANGVVVADAVRFVWIGAATSTSVDRIDLLEEMWRTRKRGGGLRPAWV